MPPRTRRQRAQAASHSDKIAEIQVENDLLDPGDAIGSTDENIFHVTPGHDNDSDNETDENSFSFPLPPPLRSLVDSIYTPRHEDVLRDITDEFFHPSSPSPIKHVPSSLKPPRRPKKPKSLAFPHDPPNWQPTSPLPPSSPLASTSTYGLQNHVSTSHAYEHSGAAFYRYAQEVEPRSRDSDPFGFFAAEKVLKERRAARPSRERKHVRSIVSRATPSPTRTKPRATRAVATPTRLVTPSVLIPTNDEDIDDLYLDEPISTSTPAPVLRHTYIPTPSSSPASLRSAIVIPPLLQPRLDTLRDQPTRSRDPLRTPRKRKRDVDAATPASSEVASSPSPVKISASTRRLTPPNRHPVDAQETTEEHTPVPKRITRSLAKGKGKITQDDTLTPRKRARTAKEDVSALVSPKQACKDLEKLLPRRATTRRAAAAAKIGGKGKVKVAVDPASESESEKRKRRRKPASKTKPASRRAKPVSKSVKQPRSKSGKAEVRGLKAKALDDVMEMSDDTRERYEQERQARLEYFRKLEGYQMQKENVYVV